VSTYKVTALGAEKNGHPEIIISQNLRDASQAYDLFCEKYPHHEIVVVEYREFVLRNRAPKPIPPPAFCPKGHKGRTDGKPLIVQTGPRRYYCGICGEIWQTN